MEQNTNVCLYPTNANTLGLVIQTPTEGSTTGEGTTLATTTEEEEEQQEEEETTSGTEEEAEAIRQALLKQTELERQQLESAVSTPMLNTDLDDVTGG
jgi:glycerol dehydrogenase-like iron-containing ADH family enzyme